MKHVHSPQISVIIPTFTRAGGLGRAIDSVLAQTFTSKKIIVVDDGPTDGTLELLVAYGDRIRVFTQPNKSVSVARNLGIRHSCAEFIALLDSDDRWEPETRACQATFFISHPPGHDLSGPGNMDPQKQAGQSHAKTSKTIGYDFWAIASPLSCEPVSGNNEKNIFDVKGVFNEGFLVMAAKNVAKLQTTIPILGYIGNCWKQIPLEP